MLLVGLLNLVWPSYGVAFLDLARSIYPGYGSMSGGVIVGTLYAVVDGMVMGAIFAWLYNLAAGPGTSVGSPSEVAATAVGNPPEGQATHVE